jgi:hypothetical protein
MRSRVSWRRRSDSRLNKGRSPARVMEDSRGRVWHRPPDSTPAAIRSPRDRIATGDHTLGVPAKPHTELRAAAVAAGRNQLAANSRLAGHSLVAGRKLKADRSQVAGHTRQMAYSPVAGHKRKVDRRSAAVGLHPLLRRDQKKLHQRRTALPWSQSQ